jgi:hypothetical protein
MRHIPSPFIKNVSIIMKLESSRGQKCPDIPLERLSAYGAFNQRTCTLRTNRKMRARKNQD